MRKVILRNFQSPGDILMLTAAVRDLHRCNPGKFLTDVRTSCPALWNNNPFITPLIESDAKVDIVDCHYPLIHRSNQRPRHFIEGFMDFLSKRLDVKIIPTEFKADLHLADSEKEWPLGPIVNAGFRLPFWIVVAGGKRDFTVKWWARERFQQVVDHFRERILFVQVGEEGHVHPPLRGAVNLVGKTSARQLVRLMHHAQGVLCPVTFAMHLAAAVPAPGDQNGEIATRPCVVIAGGREPVQWEAYPHHQFIHTIGALPCCRSGGCWRSRTLPLGDGDEKDQPKHLCVDVVEDLPRCMHMITPEEVCRRIELYFAGGVIPYLTPAEAGTARHMSAGPERSTDAQFAAS